MTKTLTQGELIAQRFSVVSLAGSGGMGVVYRAHDHHKGEQVALKLLHSSGVHGEDAERFLREAQLLAKLRHPGIVSYVAHGITEAGQPYLAMEWLEGEDLAQRLARQGLTLKESLALVRRAAAALSAIHHSGVVHRDLKPSNLFLRNRQVEGLALLDFGIARPIVSPGMTKTGFIVGTVDYMAPEQARGERQLDPSVDIFALGTVLFECLIGKPPFSGKHMAAVLTKVLFEQAPRLRALRPELPVALEGLLAQLLAKEPTRRPPDGGALLAMLDALALDYDAAAPLPGILSAQESLGGSEQQLVSFLVASLPQEEMIQAQTLSAGSPDAEFDGFRDGVLSLLSRYGLRGAWLVSGTLVATLTLPGSATDQAVQAARGALALKAHWPDAHVALTIGQGLLQEPPTVLTGDGLDQAGQLVARAAQTPEAKDAVLLDKVTAQLLDARFVVESASSAVFLLQYECSSADETRLLLGQPTPCIGRERELVLLESAFTQCVEEEEAHAVLLIAPAGTGKSRLRHEFVRRLQARGEPLELLFGRGDPMSAGSSYGLLGQALRRLCGVLDGEAPALRRAKLQERLGLHLAAAEAARVVEFLGELTGIPFPDAERVQLRAARQDPHLMAEHVRAAFLDFLAAECAQQPVILVLEDLHWGDALTVALVDAALRQLAGLPLLVLALARPEVKELFPRLWADRRLEEVRLRGLSRKACARLATQVLGSRASESTVARIVEQAAGNALILEELIRAVAEGKDAERPDTVLALLQSRLLRLETGPRRALRAASVFGERFWRGGVLELLRTHEDPDRWLDTLVDLEFIERHRDSRFPGETEYQFRHALVRDAAYSLLTHEDRQLGHRLASSYLQRIGEPDPLVLAEHYQQGGEPGRAFPFFIAAAEQAFAGNDMAGALKRAERALQCGASGETLGLLRGLQCKVCVERDDWAAALPLGKEALALLPRGGVHFCEAMGYMVVVAGLAAPESLPELVALARSIEPVPEALPSFIMADSGLIMILGYLGLREHALFFLERVERLSARCSTDLSLARAVVEQARGVYTWMLGSDPWQQLLHLQESARLMAANGAVRGGLLTDCYLAITQSELGDHAAAEALLRQGLATAQHLCIPFRIVTLKLYLATVLAFGAQPAQQAEADALSAELIATPGVNGVTVGQAYRNRAQVAAAQGRWAEAEELARKACRLLRRVPPLWFSPMRLLIESLLQQERAEARELAITGTSELARLGGAGYQTIGFGLAAARAHHAAGDPESARSLLAETLADLQRRALCIPEPAARARFLEQVSDNVRVRALARKWQLPGSIPGDS